MEVKMFEIRDVHTFIPAIGILMVDGPENTECENYLIRRAGFRHEMCVILVRAECSGRDGNATYDPYSWGTSRTFQVAHLYIVEHWNQLKSGAVVDVQSILRETTIPKVSERITELPIAPSSEPIPAAPCDEL